MFAWMMILTILDLVTIGAICIVWNDLYKWITKIDKLLKFNPYDKPIQRYLNENNPYDSTPEFIKGIKNMVSELDRPSRRTAIEYSSKISRSEFDDLSDRFDSVAEDLCGHDNRLDDHESEINAVRENVEELDSELTRRVDNLEKFCYGTKEADNATEGS